MISVNYKIILKFSKASAVAGFDVIYWIPVFYQYWDVYLGFIMDGAAKSRLCLPVSARFPA